MPIPSLIAFGGLAGHGKDTVAAIIAKLASAEGITYEFSKFASDLRLAIEIITDIPAEKTTSSEDKLTMLPTRAYRTQELKDRVARAILLANEISPSSQTINNIVSVLTGKVDNQLEEEYLSILPMTIGRFLQVLGTDAFRVHVGQNVWVEAFHRRRARSGNKPTLVPDCRFPNESSSIKAAGGLTIYVRRSNYAGRNDGRLSGHVSENTSQEFLQGFDLIIDNDGSLEDLEKKIKTVVWPKLTS